LGDVIGRTNRCHAVAAHIWVRVFVPEPWLGKNSGGRKSQRATDAFPKKNFDGAVEQIRAKRVTPRNVQTAEERSNKSSAESALDNSATNSAPEVGDVFFRIW